MTVSLLSSKRCAVQWLTTLILLLLPFIRVGGQSLLRLDAPTRTLLFFGTTIRIEEFYLFLIMMLILVIGFLFITMVLGRVWCGWFCPQTTLSDVADFIDRQAASRPAFLSGALRHAGYLGVSFLTACNLIWYFISPYEFFPRLLQGELGYVAGSSLPIILGLVYVDLAFIRRGFCKTACPYGRIQLMTMDRNTFTLEFDPRRKGDCSNCGACVRACPMGIDIRRGLQVECINCGRCLDACRLVMQRRAKTGLIHYTFGRREEGGGRPVNLRSALLAILILVLSGVLLYMAVFRTSGTIKLQRNSTVQVRKLPDGGLANFFTAYLENRTSRDGVYQLVLEGETAGSTELLGPVHQIRVPANENRRIDFLVKMKTTPTVARRMTIGLMLDGKVISREVVSVMGE